MVQGRRREAWDHTASLLAAIENQFKGEKDPIVQPAERHPFHRDETPATQTKRSEKIHVTDMSLIRAAWGC